jgi:glycosyltransferase involved in cell wall biosynthesis
MTSIKIDESKLYVYPSGGVNQAIFKPLDKLKLRANYNLSDDYFICSYISAIIDNKGWETFYLASEKLVEKNNNIHFVVVGNGSKEGAFKEKVSKNNLSSNYTFFDRVAQKKLPAFYNLSDLFIFPTHKESLGLVGVEALSCGVPVIASNIGATQEYVENGKNGYLFEVGNEIELIEKISQVIKMNNLDSLKENALKSSRRFESNFCTDLLLEKLKEI